MDKAYPSLGSLMDFRLIYSSYSKVPKLRISNHQGRGRVDGRLDTVELRMLPMKCQLGQQKVDVFPDKRPVTYYKIRLKSNARSNCPMSTLVIWPMEGRTSRAIATGNTSFEALQPTNVCLGFFDCDRVTFCKDLVNRYQCLKGLDFICEEDRKSTR